MYGNNTELKRPQILLRKPSVLLDKKKKTSNSN